MEVHSFQRHRWIRRADVSISRIVRSLRKYPNGSRFPPPYGAISSRPLVGGILHERASVGFVVGLLAWRRIVSDVCPTRP